MTENNIRNLVTTLLWRLYQLIATIVISIIYRGPNDHLTPIREDCLLGSAASLAARIRTKKITSAEAVRACIRRIEEINGTTNCVVANRFEDAIKEAEEVDRFLTETSKSVGEIEKEKPFLGVPFTAKDSIAIKGMIHAAGSVELKDVKAKEDSEAVALLRAAGAIPLALTNVPEFLAWWDTNSRLHGRCRNPYHSNYMAGGSSGGEAALIAAAGSVMGLGSDIGGSIRVPSYCCGVFGHKPTPGLVSLKGHIPEELNKDVIGVIGPISKFATDLKPILKVIAKDSNKNLKLDDPVDIKRLRYFYMENDGNNSWFSLQVDPNVKKAIKSVVDYFKKTHGIQVEKIELPQIKNSESMWWAKLLNSKEGVFVSPPKWAAWELIKALLGLSKHTAEVPFIQLLQSQQPLFGSDEHKYWVEQADQLGEEFQTLLKDDAVLFYPTLPVPPLKHGLAFSHCKNFMYTGIFNATRMPATQCPILQTEDGLPVGLQVAAARYQDRITLAVAEELEKAFGGWKPPPSQPKW